MSKLYVRCCSQTKWGSHFKCYPKQLRDLSIITENGKRFNIVHGKILGDIKNSHFKVEFTPIDQCKSCKWSLKMALFRCFKNNYEAL